MLEDQPRRSSGRLFALVTMNKLRLIVADDETLVRQGLCGLLSLEADFEIVAEAANGADALAAIRRFKPDVVLMDIQMPQMNGVEATRAIVAEQLHTRILILTTFSDENLIVEAIQSGAHGYLLKDSGGKQIAAAVRSTAFGYLTLGDRVGDKIVKNVCTTTVATNPTLTARETEVLGLLGKGHSTREIAEQLQITEKTVRDHIGNILIRLNLRDRTQAALWGQSRK